MNEQSVTSKKGEIEFRKKLVEQQVEGKSVLADEFSKDGIVKILRDRMNTTLVKMNGLKTRGVDLSSYVEIGAERCQRSLVLENDFSSKGAACDISFDMLKSGEYYRKIFNQDKIPLRICCDANLLPFRSNSLPFIFCFETLHHFPNPAPIIREVHRTLAPGGYFFFDEEPFRKTLHVDLYRTANVYSEEGLNASLLRRGMDFFFGKPSCNEVGHGIIENDDISIPVWKQALSIFEEKDIRLEALKKIHSELFEPKSSLNYFLAYMLGGGISGLCHKPGTMKTSPILDTLICPVCRQVGRESNVAREDDYFTCSTCGSKFPIVDGVLFLFSFPMLEELYPDVFKMAGKIQQ